MGDFFVLGVLFFVWPVVIDVLTIIGLDVNHRLTF
jgi:hypothetical protein